jgi:hypothetical protein
MIYVVYVVVALGWLGMLLTSGKLSERVFASLQGAGGWRGASGSRQGSNGRTQ